MQCRPDPKTAEACCRLAELARVPLLGIGLAEDTYGQAIFQSVDLYPDLQLGGDAMIDHLVSLAAHGAPA